MRDIVTQWNVLTSNWMRRCFICVYKIKGAPFLPLLSPTLWHGFYPGYYFTFIFFDIETEAARKILYSNIQCSCYDFFYYLQIRRLVRPYFQGSLPLKWGYDVATWTATRKLLDFGTLPFEFMWVYLGLRFWGFYYYIPVIAVCVVAFLFPSGRSSGQKKTKTKPATATTTITTGNHSSTSTSNDEVLVDKKTV